MIEALAALVGLFIAVCYILAMLAMIAAVAYILFAIVIWIMGGF